MTAVSIDAFKRRLNKLMEGWSINGSHHDQRELPLKGSQTLNTSAKKVLGYVYCLFALQGYQLAIV